MKMKDGPNFPRHRTNFVDPAAGRGRPRLRRKANVPTTQARHQANFVARLKAKLEGRQKSGRLAKRGGKRKLKFKRLN
jgi:hypothetical protein